MNKILSFFNNKRALRWAVVLLIVGQPFIDLDYLVYDFLTQFGIPRISTLVRFVFIPLIMLWTFYLEDKNKKKTFLCGGLYGVCVLIWFIIHTMQGKAIYDDLFLTTNFQFSLFQELTYLATLLLPYGVIYMVYQLNYAENMIKRMVLFLSGFTGISILLGDLYVFGISTYEGMTVANIFTWFTGIYDVYHPRLLASKFFFYEGNTMGILMFMILPILYYFFTKAKKRNEKLGIGALIVIQSLSMIILSTRVATYGTILVPAAFIVIYLLDVFLFRNSKFSARVVLFTAVMGILCTLILPYSPAIVNQQIDAKNDLALINNGAAAAGKDAFDPDDPLIPGTAEFNYYYIFQFEEYGIRAKYATSIPSMYYSLWYSYQHDPYFWCEVIFDYEVEERVSGRQIQSIFFNEKWEVLDDVQRFFGMGYSTFMNGSIVLEKDFVQQIYTLGYLGAALTMTPWILLVLFGAICVLVKWKDLLRMDIMVYAMSVVMGLGAGYTSGHTMDEFITSFFIAFIIGVLLTQIKDAYKGREIHD